MKIALISCVSKKRKEKSRARELYISPLFKYNLAYAQILQADRIYILSAKYGLVQLDDEIEPYEQTLNKMNAPSRKVWATRVVAQLREQNIDLAHDTIIFLAGSRYREYLQENLAHFVVPLQGLGIGRQLKFLKDKVQEFKKSNASRERQETLRYD